MGTGFRQLLLSSLWLAAGCRHAAAVPSPVSRPLPVALAPVAATTLGAGDVFEVRIFQEPDLSGAYRLSSGGTINFPLCGTVHLGGLSTEAAAHALAGCLANGYLRSPQVSIFVKEYNSKKIFVFGEVQKPGTFQYEDGMNIVQAITLAGGFTTHAAENTTSVTRSFEGTERRVKVAVEDIGLGRAENFQLRPGDIIFVPESIFR
ncbi:MAG: polysaccharide biosynthesis/export family protein [Myxococcales bacterium]